MAKVLVDTKELAKLGKDLGVARLLSLGRLGERGYQHLRAEVPVEKGNLKQGVSPPDIDNQKMTATLTVSARSAAQGAGTGTVHYPDSPRHPGGHTKQVALKPQLPYNYAEVVALGNKDAVVKPKVGKVFLIPVITTPTDEPYLTIGEEKFVFRGSHKGMKPNRFDERAADKLGKEAPAIVGKVFEELFN